MNYTVKDLEPSLNLTHNDVDILKKQFKAETEERISEIELSRKAITVLEHSLKEKVERNTNLEQYTRRENLRLITSKKAKTKIPRSSSCWQKI